MEQIIIKKIQKPHQKIIKKDIDWVCDSFGFSVGRDTNYISKKIIHNLLDRLSKNALVSSDIIADDLKTTNSIINHHLRSLINTGIIYREKKGIYLRGGNLKSSIEEMRKDTNRLFDNILEIAQEIDDALGFKNR